MIPERDRRGELAFRAVSYTPWPVEEGAAGERLRVEVGPVEGRQLRTFVFEKVRRAGGARVSGAGREHALRMVRNPKP